VVAGEGSTLVTTYGGIWWASAAIPVAHLWGELDVTNAVDVFGVVREGADGRDVVVDLSDVAFMGSSVLSELVSLTRDAPVRVVAPPGSGPRHLLELTGLTDIISTFPTVATALNAH
jgi:anti-anti-sigma factor